VSANTYRFGRAAAWSAVVLLVVAGIIGAIAGSWSDVALAAAALAISAAVLAVGRRTRSHR
jgi:uncharacterized membrane protein YfcA